MLNMAIFLFSVIAAGIRSVAVTNIILAAAKLSNAGSTFIMMLEKKYAKMAPPGSVIALQKPYMKALRLFLQYAYIGKLTLAPSGKFCMPMPMASAIAEEMPPPIQAAKATPIHIPSGKL